MRNEWLVVKTRDVDVKEYEALLQRVRDRCPPSGRVVPVLWAGERKGDLMLPGAGDPIFLADDPTIRSDITLAGVRLEGLLLHRQPGVVLFPATEEGKQTAAWLAGRMGTGLTADLTDFYMDREGRLHQIRMAYGGSLQAEILCRGNGIQMATVKIQRKAASVIVAGGLGAGKEGFVLLKELAARLGGELGATRAAVDAGLAPFSCQIGQSGNTVRPDLYLAFGISGAVQHLAGMRESRRVVAVNTDRKAPVFRYADHAVCADASEIARLMLRLLEKNVPARNERS